MKLENRDIAEALGLVYNGVIEQIDGEYYHYFQFCSKDFYYSEWRDLEECWEMASEEVLEPLMGLIVDKL